MSHLVWKRCPQSDDIYALCLAESGRADVSELKRLFEIVKHLPGGRQRHFSQKGTALFELWLQDISQPLPSQAYALLSNWFLTRAKADRESELGCACGDLWDALFAVRPSERLTPVKRNHMILKERFAVWWNIVVNRR